jgi:hypothetical protein
LLPEPHNQQILDLLFEAAHWHSLAKLRMHNDLTLDIMDAVTVSLGEKLREFNDTTCSAFITRELEREFNARVRRQAKEAAKKNNTKSRRSGSDAVDAEANDPHRPRISIESQNAAADGPRTNARRLKHFNLNTYKAHALGDYTATIRRYGTTDSYSTEPVSIFKSTPKMIYSELLHRVNWSTARQKHGIPARAANDLFSK